MFFPMANLEIAGHKLLKFVVGPSCYLMNPTDGARLLNWHINLADGSVRDVIYWPENAPLGGEELGSVKGGAPILFPFAGASWVGAQEGYWKSPEGKVLPMRKHGFANWGKYEIDFIDERQIHLRYLPSEADKESYPYNYEFLVCYRFSELSFSVEFLLRNNSSEKIPWAAGYHPYFSMPWHENLSKKDYRLICDARKACNVRADSTFVPENNLDKMCFADPEMMSRIHTHLKSGVFRFGPKNGEEDITITVDGGASKGGYCMVVWAQEENSPYHCVEPWMSVPNSSTNPKHFVDPRSRASFVVEVSIA